MRSSSHGGSRACAMAAFLVLLFGCFALCVHCRSPVLKDDEESKIKLVMCVYKGLQCVEGDPCYCCVLERPEPRCYYTHSECVAKCPFCYPPPCSRPAAGPAVEGRPGVASGEQ